MEGVEGVEGGREAGKEGGSGGGGNPSEKSDNFLPIRSSKNNSKQFKMSVATSAESSSLPPAPPCLLLLPASRSTNQFNEVAIPLKSDVKLDVLE